MPTLLTVGIIVLVFALIVVLLIPVIKGMTQVAQWEYELRQSSVTIQGQIVYRHEMNYKNHSYSLKYKYIYGGVSYQHFVSVEQSDYEAHPVGTEVTVICHPQHPQIAHMLIRGRLDGIAPH